MTMLNGFFARAEFACKCGKCACDTVDAELLNVLTEVRERFMQPVIITSGHRCPSHNANVGGGTRSYHLLGRAADIVVEGVNPEWVYKHLDNLFPEKYGLGRYDTFTHVDTRGARSRWAR